MRRYAPNVRHVIVDMGGDPISSGTEIVIDLSVDGGSPLPLSRARNIGAEHARSDVIVFLDVDCLPGPGLAAFYTHRVERYRGIWSGPVGFLPPPAEIDAWTPECLTGIAHFHEGRPRVGQQPGPAPSTDMFWSLSFAVSYRTWNEIGGFDEAYVGYGGEDTDFACTASQRGVALWFDGSAVAFHQHHPVSTPPIEHLDDIVRNAELFHAKWNRWPMTGWLTEFARRDLIDWAPDSDRIASASSNR